MLAMAASGSLPANCGIGRPSWPSGEPSGRPRKAVPLRFVPQLEATAPPSSGYPSPAQCLVEQGETHPNFQETRAVSRKFHKTPPNHASAEPPASSLVMATHQIATLSGRCRLLRRRPLQHTPALSIKLCHTKRTHADPPPLESGQRAAIRRQFREKRFLTPRKPAVTSQPASNRCTDRHPI